ncbi:EAL domain-containing protein [Fictibacillus aquaticus]|uniref:EAL domain-containing protein n=1 Tax=Fictibacillus aquaticus TaxID=2021314 RepID=A0A235FCZ3_9BACL|nr:EAL domain-containing protein [Fictibacillus aquaticus]OYD59196.1 hypothetical protein CGZ90_04670 [Fictibacillus aquaticus]
MNCTSCTGIAALAEKGDIAISHPNPSIMSTLGLLFSVTETGGIITLPYSNLDDVQRLISSLEDEYSSYALSHFSFQMISEEDAARTTSVSFSEFKERVKRPDLYSVIASGLFTTHCQPIVNLQSGEVYGFELLLRPIEGAPHFYPYELFQFAQKAGLQSLLDSKARVESIHNSSKYLPEGLKRFINFLPSSIYDPNHCLKTTFKAAAETGTNPADLVFEVVETEEILDMDHLQSILDVYKEKGMKVALDDLGAGHSTEDVLKRLNPHFVKIDRDIISFCDLNSDKQKKLLDTVKTASEIGTIVLAEGIEREEEAEWCREAGIHLAQGYYYGKPAPPETYYKEALL